MQITQYRTTTNIELKLFLGYLVEICQVMKNIFHQQDSEFF